MTLHDVTDTALIAEMRAQLEATGNELAAWRARADEALQVAESNAAEVRQLRRALVSDADSVDAADATHEAKSSAFWFAAWKERNRQRTEDKLRITQLEREVSELRCGDLPSFYDGELTGARAAAFRDHLGRCQSCRSDLADMERVEGIMRETAPSATRNG